MKKKQLTFNQARKRALIIALFLSLCVFTIEFVFFRMSIELLIEIPIATFIIIFAISFILLSQNCSDIKKNPVSYDPEWEKRMKEKFAKNFVQADFISDDQLKEMEEEERLNSHYLHIHHYWD